MYPSVHSSIIDSCQDKEAALSVPSTDKDVCVHVHACNRILLSPEKEWDFAIVATWMDLEGIVLSEIKSEKDKYYMLSLTCRI